MSIEPGNMSSTSAPEREATQERRLMLRGLNGYFDGEVFLLDKGDEVVVGRSRACDFSIKGCRRYREAPSDVRRNDRHLAGVSRRHFRINYCHESMIEIRDLSLNGTWVNDRRVRKLVISDLSQRRYEIRMGHEQFVLEWEDDHESATEHGSSS